MKKKFSNTSQIPSISRDEIVDIAREWIGTPYVHQMSTMNAGADCLGLVRGIWRALYQFEPELPPAYTPDWNEKNWNQSTGKDVLFEAAQRHLVERSDASIEPGDILIFRVQRFGPTKHCGIYSGDNRFIHAYSGRNVCENWLNRWWYSRIAAVFCFPGVI